MKVEIDPIPTERLGLQVGEIGVTPDSTIILRAYSSYINLENPQETWTNPDFAKELIPLPKGTRVILTV